MTNEDNDKTTIQIKKSDLPRLEKKQKYPKEPNHIIITRLLDIVERIGDNNDKPFAS